MQSNRSRQKTYSPNKKMVKSTREKLRGNPRRSAVKLASEADNQ